jgi:hypothetical protein
VTEEWALHPNTASLIKKGMHTFENWRNAVPHVIFFDNGVAGLRCAQQTVAKYFKSYESFNDNVPVPMMPPLYVSLTNYSGWQALSQVVQDGVPALPPTVHTGFVQDKKKKDHLSNTWVFAHVADTSRAKVWTKTPDAHLHPISSSNKISNADQQTDQILENLGTIMQGDREGHAFVSMGSSSIDVGPSLAALVVERYTRGTDTVWDLCGARPLLSLPMALLSAGRMYVGVIGPDEARFAKMVSDMYDINYLKHNCSPLFDGPWHISNGGCFSKHTVLTFPCSPLCLPLCATHPCCLIESKTMFCCHVSSGSVRSVPRRSSRSQQRHRVVDALPDRLPHGR